MDNSGQPQFGRIVDTGDRVELRLLISTLEHPDTATEMTVVTWSRGNTNLVISVPHGGTIGAHIENINTVSYSAQHNRRENLGHFQILSTTRL